MIDILMAKFELELTGLYINNYHLDKPDSKHFKFEIHLLVAGRDKLLKEYTNQIPDNITLDISPDDLLNNLNFKITFQLIEYEDKKFWKTYIKNKFAERFKSKKYSLITKTATTWISIYIKRCYNGMILNKEYKCSVIRSKILKIPVIKFLESKCTFLPYKPQLLIIEPKTESYVEEIICDERDINKIFRFFYSLDLDNFDTASKDVDYVDEIRVVSTRSIQNDDKVQRCKMVGISFKLKRRFLEKNKDEGVNIYEDSSEGDEDSSSSSKVKTTQILNLLDD